MILNLDGRVWDEKFKRKLLERGMSTSANIIKNINKEKH